jgi:colicin import membrane protein
MTSSTLSRDPFMPRQPKGRGPALALALLAHVLLIAALTFGVHWRSSQPTMMSAELWSAVPQAAAPRAVEPPPATPPPEVKKPPAVVKAAEPVTPTPPQPDPQIAIEKAKREDERRVQAEQDRQAQLKREKALRDEADRDKDRQKQEQAQKKAEADKAKADKDKADKAEAARQEAARVAQLKRVQGLAGANGGPTDTGTALRSSGPSASYAGRIMARIKPNIVFSDSVDGNPMATVEVTLAPDGTIVAKRLVKSSGVKSWDDAVLRAIERTEVLPRDVDGRVPPPFQIDFKPRE